MSILFLNISCGSNEESNKKIVTIHDTTISKHSIVSHPILTETNRILIPLTSHSINVIPACSAYSFFCLLYAMVASHLFHRFRKQKAVLFSILVLPIVYGITIVTNGCRIICAYYVNEIGRHLLPSNFQAALHQGIGIILFLSVIMGMYLLLERIFHYEFKQ